MRCGGQPGADLAARATLRHTAKEANSGRIETTTGEITHPRPPCSKPSFVRPAPRAARSRASRWKPMGARYRNVGIKGHGGIAGRRQGSGDQQRSLQPQAKGGNHDRGGMQCSGMEIPRVRRSDPKFQQAQALSIIRSGPARRACPLRSPRRWQRRQGLPRSGSAKRHHRGIQESGRAPSCAGIPITGHASGRAEQTSAGPCPHSAAGVFQRRRHGSPMTRFGRSCNIVPFMFQSNNTISERWLCSQPSSPIMISICR